MKSKSEPPVKKLLKPYRRKIDQLDDRILALLGQRFGVVKKVAAIKIKHDIPNYIGDRVEEVRNRAVAGGMKYGIDPGFMRTLYTMIIYQSCAVEELMKAKKRKKKKA